MRSLGIELVHEGVEAALLLQAIQAGGGLPPCERGRLAGQQRQALGLCAWAGDARGTSSQDLDQTALSSNLGRSNPRSRARQVLAARSWQFLSLPNCAPEVFVHARRHIFVVRISDVFAYRLRVLEAVTANAAMPLIAGRRCTDATRGFSGRLWDLAFSNPAKRIGTALARMSRLGWP
jgi:hypothetical protein